MTKKIFSLCKKAPFFSLRLLQNWSFTKVNSQFISFASLKNKAFFIRDRVFVQVQFLNYCNLILIALATILSLGCSNNNKPKANPNIPPKFVEAEPVFKNQGKLCFMHKKDTLSTINIEIADTPKKTAKGLMYRKHMEESNGMLFIFETERRQSFWMKNTHISLDIIFVNANKEIVFIAPNTVPHSTKQIPSFEYAQYVVEVNAGFCQRYDIKIGDLIDFIRT